MTIFISISVILIATFLITRLNSITQRFTFSVSKTSYVDSQFKYQLLLLALAGAVLCMAYLLNREAFLTFFTVGNPSAPAMEVPWFGIGKGESWATVGITSGAVITLATLLFMSLGVWQAKAKPGVMFRFFPWIILFSLTNSFAEEAIYRLGIIIPLYGTLGIGALTLLSAVLFGIPHYHGVPSGFIGVVMASVLGWFLAKSIIETQGIGWAWGIHFLQDIVIYSGIIIMMTKKEKAI